MQNHEGNQHRTEQSQAKDRTGYHSESPKSNAGKHLHGTTPNKGEAPPKTEASQVQEDHIEATHMKSTGIGIRFTANNKLNDDSSYSSQVHLPVDGCLLRDALTLDNRDNLETRCDIADSTSCVCLVSVELTNILLRVVWYRQLCRSR